MNLENILNNFQKKLNKDAGEVTKNVTLEKEPLESEFKQFLNFSKTMEADHDTVAGKPREYVDTAKLWKAYQQAFGDAAVDKRTTEYRMARINPEDFPEDFMVIPDQIKANNTEYFANRLNEKLLKRIYMPATPGDLSEIMKDTAAHHGDLQAMNELHDASEPTAEPKPRHMESDNDFSWEIER